MEKLEIEFTTGAAGQPLAIVRNFPGLSADMTPEEMRDMAHVLLDAAGKSEAAFSYCPTLQKLSQEIQDSPAAARKAQDLFAALIKGCVERNVDLGLRL